MGRSLQLDLAAGVLTLLTDTGVLSLPILWNGPLDGLQKLRKKGLGRLPAWAIPSVLPIGRLNPWGLILPSPGKPLVAG